MHIPHEQTPLILIPITQKREEHTHPLITHRRIIARLPTSRRVKNRPGLRGRDTRLKTRVRLIPIDELVRAEPLNHDGVRLVDVVRPVDGDEMAARLGLGGEGDEAREHEAQDWELWMFSGGLVCWNNWAGGGWGRLPV
jgi:hypothetical protein